MNLFLSDYIFSMASRSREKVQTILAASQTSKENLDEIANRIENSVERAPIQIRPETYGGIISDSNLDGVSRDVDIRMRELFDESNLISLLLDSHTNILSSEVKRQSDQLDAFQKYVNNYTFMLADQGFYDHAYSESFSDDIQKEIGDTLQTMLYDRSGSGFDRQLEILDVDQGAGILTMSASFVSTYQLFPFISNSNCSAHITSDSGIEKSVSEAVGEGWRVAISSPRPIASSFSDGYDKGAQFEIEYALASPAPCDTFSITPMSDTTMDILSIKIYGEDVSQHKEILENTHRLKKNSVFYFDQEVISKVVLVVNQPLYTRGKLPPSKAEREYKDVLEAQRSELKFGNPQSKENSRKAFHRLFNKWFLKSEKKRAALQRPSTRLDKYAPVDLGAADVLSYQKEANRVFSSFKYADPRRNIFNRWMIERIFYHQPELLERFTGDQKIYKKPVGPIPYVLKDERLDDNVDPMNYEYALGIRNVRIGITVDKGRGLFVSKPIPSPVQSGEVRLQAEHTNFTRANSYLDNPQVTTIEYSVTNKSNPISEQDWIPILPAFEKGSSTQERLFVQSSGYGSFRFPASSTGLVNVYKNGFLLSDAAMVKSSDQLSIIGVRIPQSEFSLNTDDIYTVIYLPIGDPTTVNFGDKGFQQKNVASSYDDNGAGELFSQTGNSYTVTLSNYAFVDFNKIERESSYSSQFGLTGTYQPIKVVLSDGTIAYNYTNYVGIRQNLMKSSDQNLAFLHSGKQIIFNKQIDQEFRVYYQYEPSYLRYRIIFRINTIDKVSPFVDSLTVKMKLNSSILGMNSKKV